MKVIRMSKSYSPGNGENRPVTVTVYSQAPDNPQAISDAAI
jgi:hypothetical protein